MSSLDDAVSGLLAGWGITAAGTTTSVAGQLAAACADRGVPDVAVSVRWNRAIITASPAGAARLRWCLEALSAAASQASAGEVTEVKVRSGLRPEAPGGIPAAAAE